MIIDNDVSMLPAWPDAGRPGVPPFPLVHPVDYEPVATTLPGRDPLPIVTFTQPGRYLGGILEWFYYRFHFDGSVLYDFGLVAGDRVAEFKFWAAFFNSTSLETVEESSVEGTYLTGVTSPATLTPLQELNVTLTVTDEGPPAINGYYAFPFSDTNETARYQVDFVGQRVLIWQVKPDWAQPIEERYEFNTKVLEADDGSEQRISLRNTARNALTAYFTPRGVENGLVQRALALQDRVFAVPYWVDLSRLLDAVSPGTIQIQLTKDIPDLTVGDTLLIETGSKLEAFVVGSLVGGAVQLTVPINSEVAAGARIWRAIFARVPSEQSRKMITSTVGALSVEYDVQTAFSPLRRIATKTWPTFRGLPVLPFAPDWSNSVNATHRFERFDLDFGGDNRAFYFRWPYGLVVTQNDFVLTKRQDVDDFIDFFMGRRGRQKPFWVSSKTADLVPVANLDQSAAAIRVDTEEVALAYENNENHRNIEVKLTDGRTFYRQVQSMFAQNGYTEFVLTGTWPETIFPEQVARISWLFLSRFESDVMTMSRPTSEHATVSMATRSLRDDA